MIPFPNKKYNIIYADPCWQYSDPKKNRGGALRHYNTLGYKEISKLDVNSIAGEDCILFLWVTFPKLLESFDVIHGWGFEYKTIGFNWVKKNKISDSWFWGMGSWTRSNAEVCLIGVKGKPKRISASVHSVIDAKIDKHSKKPDCVRDKIVELCGDLPRIELFARQKVEGWDSWGNETEEETQMSLIK